MSTVLDWTGESREQKSETKPKNKSKSIVSGESFHP